MEIIWREFPDEKLKNKYEISNDGQVRNKNTKVVKKTNIRSGYENISLLGQNTNQFKIHRMVAMAFIRNDDPEKNIVNHKDGNKTNNNVSNLEWTTIQGNNQHSMDSGLTPKTCRAVYQYKDNGEIVKYSTITGAGKATNVDSGSIAKVCKGRQKTAGGYKWEFVDKNENERDVDLSEYIKVKGYTNYMINRNGDVYSIPFKKLMKQNKHADGYKQITLSNNGKSKSYLIHRLLAEHYIENDDPNNKKNIKHINGNSKDNRIENLEWSK
jgi:hypothetical protein